MTKFHISVWLTSLSLLLPGHAKAGTANELLENCKTTLRSLDGDASDMSHVMRSQWCISLVNTVVDTTFIHQSQLGKSLFCTPQGVSTEQAIRIVVKYLTANPEQLHRPDSVMAVEALKEAFPCK